jgi:hypothetical protein
MFWLLGKDGNPVGYALYSRHYSASRYSAGRKRRRRQFVGPGEKMVLLGFMCAAVFAWQKQRYRRDGQQGVNCTIFRNESPHRSSDMIREAMSLAWERWPGERLFTLVDPRKVQSSNPGYCFLMAGWRKCGQSKNGKLIFEVLPSESP